MSDGNRRPACIAVLGSTGSVGRQTLEVAEFLGIRVETISGCRNVSLLEEQIRKFRPRICAVADENAARDLRMSVRDTATEILSGSEGVTEAARSTEADIVCNSVTGTAGLFPTLAAIEAGKHVALSNKETIVTAGEYVMCRAHTYGVRILPVDSEHSAIFQCLRAGKQEQIERLLLTCSGGPFYGRKREDLALVTPKEALAHPTWNMGPKITVDCGTLMNKGLELIEAVHLFGVPPEKVEVLIHRESIVHSLAEFSDRAVIAQLSVPDMRLCIQYALTYPERCPSLLKPLDLTKIGCLTFAEPDTEAFPLLKLARHAAAAGGVLPAVLNGANEAAVSLFLEGKISFTEISDAVGEVVCGWRSESGVRCLEDILEADRLSRERLNALCGASADSRRNSVTD